MKKLSYLFLIMVCFVFISCPGKDGPVVTLVPSATEGTPGVNISFDASESEVAGGKKLTYCQFEVFDSTEKRIVAETKCMSENKDDFAIFNYEFTKVGIYKVVATIADYKKRTNSSSVEIKITSLFSDDMSYNLGYVSEYQNMPLSIEALGLDVSNVSAFTWQINKKDSGETVLQKKDKSFTLENGLVDAGAYIVKLIIADSFGNTKEFQVEIEILSAEQPLPIVTVFNTEPPEEQKLIAPYEHQIIKLSAEGSKADNLPDSENKIVSYAWYIYREVSAGVFAQVGDSVKKTTPDPFDYQLGESGNYSIELECFSKIGKTAISDPVTFTSLKNEPVIENFSLDFGENITLLYEGENCTVDITVDTASTSMLKGEIIEVLMDFDDPSVADIVINASDDSTPCNFVWIPPFKHETTSLTTYTGAVYVKNGGGRLSDGYSFSQQVLSDTPKAILTTNGESFFFGNTLSASATGSKSPVGDDLESILIKLTNITDSQNPTIVKEQNVTSNPNELFSYTFPSNSPKDLKYELEVKVTNKSGTAKKKKELFVSTPYLLAGYTMTPDPDQEEVFAGRTILLNTSSSQPASSSTPITDWKWTVKKLVSGGSTSELTGLVVGSEPNFNLTIDEPGTYTVKLEVSAGVETATKIRTISLMNNVPFKFSITKNDDGAGNYTFTGSAVSPDGQALSYQWYFDEHPASASAIPVGTETALNYRIIDGAVHAVYLVATNPTGGKGIGNLTFTAKDLQAPEAPAVTVLTPTALVQPTWRWTPAAGDVVIKYRYYLAIDNVVKSNLESSDWKETFNGEVFSYKSDSDLTEGKHTLYVQAQDDSENWPDPTTLDSQFTGSAEVTIDLTPPDAPTVTSVSSRTNNAKPTWTWNTPADAQRFRWQVDGEDAGSWVETSNTSYTPLIDLETYGTNGHTLYVQAVDVSGGWSDSGSFEVIVDLDPPDVAIVENENDDNYVNDRTPAWDIQLPTLTGGDSIIGFRVKVDDESWLAVTDLSSLPSAITENGGKYTYIRPAGAQLSAENAEGDTHILYVQVLDMAGNWSASAQSSVIIDTTPLPFSAITINGSSKTKDETPSWSFSGTSAVIKLRYQFNSDSVGNFIIGTSYTHLTNLSEGTYQMYVQALDGAGNWSLAKSFQTIVDLTPPIVAWATGHSANEKISYGDTSYGIMNTDITVNDLVDGDISGTASVVAEVTGFPSTQTDFNCNYPGNYAFTYTATDTAGNVATLTKSVVVLPPNPTFSSATLSHKTYLEPFEPETLTINSVTGNSINSFGGALTYTWSVSQMSSWSDSTPQATDRTQDITFNAGDTNMTINVEVAYADYPEVKASTSFPVSIHSAITVINGDFESPQTVSGTSVPGTTAPWLWNIDYQWHYANLLTSTNKNEIEGTYDFSLDPTTHKLSDSTNWEDICGLDMSDGINGSVAAVFCDNSMNNASNVNAIIKTAGKFYSSDIAVKSGITYIAKAKVWRDNNEALNIPFSFAVQGQSITMGGDSEKKVNVATGSGWHDVSIEFTPDSAGNVKLEFFKGASWNPTDMVNGTVRVDNVDIDYKN